MNHSAGDPRTAAHSRSRLTGESRVGIAVKDDRRSVGVKQRQRTVTQRHARGHRVERSLTVCANQELRKISQVKRMVCVGIHVAGWTGIEVPAGGREIGLALSDRVQVHAVEPRLQSFDCEADVDRRDRSHLLLGEISRASDALAFDVCVGLRDDRTES